MIFLESSFLFAYLFVTIVEIYLLHFPIVITGESASSIVKEYYYKNWKTNLPLDFLLVVAYFVIAEWIWNTARIIQTSQRLLVLVAVTVVISGAWCVWYTSRPQTASFFSRWFHKVGWQAVLFDVVLLSSIYLVYVSLKRYF